MMDSYAIYVSKDIFKFIIYGSIVLLGGTVALLLTMFFKELKNGSLW